MSLDPRKRQKNLERRKAKRAKKQKLVQRDPHDLAAQFERSGAAPVLHSCVHRLLWDQGLGNVLLSRQLSNGSVAFAAFLVDVYCLGVKDATFGIVGRRQYDWQVHGTLFPGDEAVNRTPEYVRKLVEGAVDYAGNLGLPPHPDYQKAKAIFGDVDAGACTEEFVYGKDDKPLFIAGPHDSEARSIRIIHLLTDHCGRDGFHFLVPLSTTGSLPEISRI